MPALLATVVGVVAGLPGPVGGIAPLVLLSGLAVVIAAGDAIALTHQRVAIAAWFGLLLVPPALAVLALLVFPWFGLDLAINQPADAMARFFADSFQRRVGKELPIVAGDPRTAALVELGAASRPSLFLEATPARSPWAFERAVQGRLPLLRIGWALIRPQAQPDSSAPAAPSPPAAAPKR
jgi:hypothetical protein